MGDFRRFCAWFAAIIVAMIVLRQAFGGVGLMPTEEIARMAFVAVFVAAVAVAVGGQRIERP